MNNSNLVLTMLSSIGGAGVVIAGLSAWIGNLWSKRILEVEKSAHKAELARLNSELEIERKRAEVAYTQLAQMETKIDLDLRKRRIVVYKELWERTAILTKWPRSEDSTYEELHKLSEDLRDWYFTQGGMFTSRKTHNSAYAPLQEERQKRTKGT